MKLLAILIAAVISYLLGSLCFAIIFVRIIKGQDIRTMGSKNAGLTNVLRCCGSSCAVLTLVGDLCKGVLAVSLSRTIASALNAGLQYDNNTRYIGYIAAFFAILGHVFPLYFNFRGGKGVLVGVASFIFIDWKMFVILLIIFAAVLIFSNYVSLASITASACCPVITFLTSWLGDGCTLGRSALYMLLSVPMAAMVIWMHRSNINRLLNGTERKFRKSKTSGSSGKK
ncbi:MAG: glycerol-3-phosphate 1-O-acyltransferase PlsY [Ruminococcus sp.]|nr:glycerol-3-phosphate 1-O-acyltransferase PlsY [Ruminococcus sp.]